MRLPISYKSQREYGDLNMCTAVCYNVAMHYLVGTEALFSAETIDALMRQSAECYRACQGDQQLLMVADVMRCVPRPPGILSKDFGGTLCTAPEDEDLAEVEGLVVMSLLDTLQMLRETTIPVAFIATFSGHSIVFLASPTGRVLLFDPLPASVVDASTWQLCATARAAVYSGVLFGHEIA
jgi:hypothetical protein